MFPTIPPTSQQESQSGQHPLNLIFFSEPSVGGTLSLSALSNHDNHINKKSYYDSPLDVYRGLDNIDIINVNCF